MASFIGNDCLVINSWDVGEVQLVRDEFSDGILRVTLNDGSIHNAPANFFRDVFGNREVRRIIPARGVFAVIKKGEEMVKVPAPLVAISKDGEVRVIIFDDDGPLRIDMACGYQGVEIAADNLPYGVKVNAYE